MDMEKVRRVVFTGTWDEIETLQGGCSRAGHERKEEDLIPESILKDLSQFEDFLKSNPSLVSIQLGSEEKFTFDFHGSLLKLIGEYCKELECLSLFLLMEEEEVKKMDVSKT
jgi:hypothetical protein